MENRLNGRLRSIWSVKYFEGLHCLIKGVLLLMGGSLGDNEAFVAFHLRQIKGLYMEIWDSDENLDNFNKSRLTPNKLPWWTEIAINCNTTKTTKNENVIIWFLFFFTLHNINFCMQLIFLIKVLFIYLLHLFIDMFIFYNNFLHGCKNILCRCLWYTQT